MLKYTTLLLMLFSASLKSFAQFTGGNADGCSYGLLAQSICSPLVSNFVFYGGNTDGYSDGLLTQSICPPLVSDFVFYGGNADGYSDGLLTQSICPPLVSDFVFYGGIADGYSDGSLAQSICPPLVSNFVFYGGIADGYSDGSLTQSICPPLVSNFVFYGGIADGFAFAVKEQTICPNTTPLPIELLSFTAKKNKSTVDIKWVTATEINNNYFTVERSEDAINFSTLVIVNGSGNSNSEKNYAAKDNNPYNGISYYRLKQTDFDGKSKYYNIVAVDFLTDEYGVRIYPNPTNDLVTIDFPEGLLLQSNIISLTNVYGQKIELNQIISKNHIKVDLLQLPSGIYFIGINVGQKAIERKIVLQK